MSFDAYDFERQEVPRNIDRAFDGVFWIRIGSEIQKLARFYDGQWFDLRGGFLSNPWAIESTMPVNLNQAA